jgi:hypothetical protein
LESARFGMEAVEAIKTVSSLTLEKKVIERYADRLRKAVFNSSRRMMVSMIFFALSDCVDFLGMYMFHSNIWRHIDELSSHRSGLLVWWKTRLFRGAFRPKVLHNLHRYHFWWPRSWFHLWI